MDENDLEIDKVDSSRQTINQNTKIMIRSVSSLNKGAYQLSQTQQNFNNTTFGTQLQTTRKSDMLVTARNSELKHTRTIQNDYLDQLTKKPKLEVSGKQFDQSKRAYSSQINKLAKTTDPPVRTSIGKDSSCYNI